MLALSFSQKLLLAEAKSIRDHKKKELGLQKDGLESIEREMIASAGFTKSLLEKGTQVEIAKSKKSLLVRLATQMSEKIELTPCHDDVLKFAESNMTKLTAAIDGFGGVNGNLTPAKTSFLERPSGSSSKSARLNEEVSFTITSMTQEGQKIKRGGDKYSIQVDGPSKVEPKIVGNGNGTYSVSFTPIVKGEYHVSATFNGEDVKGSPFDLRVSCVSTGKSYLIADPFIFAGMKLSAKITAVDEGGTPLTQGRDQFVATLTVNDQPQNPSTITDQQDGTYLVSLPGNISGKCELSVQCDGQQIKGSPTPLSVLPGDSFGGKKQFEILYDAKVHGYSSAAFHQKCDNIDGTVPLVTLTNGANFGGYNPSRWTSDGSQQKINGTFLFSLTNGKGSGPQKFQCTNPSYATYNIATHGPLFGTDAVDLLLDLNVPASSSSSPSAYSIPSNTTLAGSYNNWSIENVQVFRVF